MATANSNNTRCKEGNKNCPKSHRPQMLPGLLNVGGGGNTGNFIETWPLLSLGFVSSILCHGHLSRPGTKDSHYPCAAAHVPLESWAIIYWSNSLVMNVGFLFFFPPCYYKRDWWISSHITPSTVYCHAFLSFAFHVCQMITLGLGVGNWWGFRRLTLAVSPHCVTLDKSSSLSEPQFLHL